MVLKAGPRHSWEVRILDGSTIIDVYDFLFTNVDGSRYRLEG